MEQQVKGIPYGKSRFDEVRRENLYYADKTMYLPLLEQTSDYLFLIRPRRFGKSLFVSMMRCYYDKLMASQFDELFSGLWIHDHPTPLKNSFQVIYFDFSMVGGSELPDIQRNFNTYVGQVLDVFAKRYAEFYDADFLQSVINEKDAKGKLTYIDSCAKDKGHKLYLIIDEYDNFTNVILSNQGVDVFRALTHASGFYRDYFKVFKAMFSRVFLIGVSPVTLDDLSSGYNIDWNISQDPRFNAMLGFNDSEVRAMFQYYKDAGSLKADADIEAMIEEMRPWYNNYCFSEDSLRDERVFNSDMTLYYLRNRVLYGRAPRDMVDKNIRTDYGKLRMLANIDRGRKRDERMSVIEKIASTGELNVSLKTSFPADKIADDDNFESLIYYYGLLTMGGSIGNFIKMVVPNNCVRAQYWAFMRDFYEQTVPINHQKLNDAIIAFAFEGNYQPLITMIAKAYTANSSVRDSLLGEGNLQGFFKAYFTISPLYLVWPEHELNYGYADFLLVPDFARYPDVAHSYIMELKYVKPKATDAEVQQKCDEAEAQLRQYAADQKLMRQCGKSKLHLLRVVFRGPEMAVCEEL